MLYIPDRILEQLYSKGSRWIETDSLRVKETGLEDQRLRSDAFRRKDSWSYIDSLPLGTILNRLSYYIVVGYEGYLNPKGFYIVVAERGEHLTQKSFNILCF